MKLYTKTGDAGDTGLFGGERVSKSHARVRAYGCVDEANSAVGVAAAAPDLPPDLGAHLRDVMSDLFDVGAELATPPPSSEKLATKLVSAVDETRVAALEQLIDDAEAVLPPLTTFVLPSGTDAAARLHFARTVVRRAEREIVAVARADDVNERIDVRPAVLVYINRLSDLLFAWARLANHRAGRADVPWQARKAQGGRAP